MTNRFEGRVVAVIGALSPVAKACTRRLNSEGAATLEVDVSLRADQTDWLTVPDVVSAESARFVADECERRWGRLDVLVYAVSAIDSGFTAPADGAPDLDDWDRVYKLNVWGPVTYARTLLPLMEVSGRGSIVFLSSVDGIYGNAAVPAFSTSKGALNAATHVLAHDAAARRVRVNAVATGALLQSREGDPGPEHHGFYAASAIAQTPLGRMPTFEDVSGVVAFYASDDAAYVSGTVLPVDGGRTGISPGSINLP